MAKQRQIRIEQRLPEQLMEEMAARSDEQLEAETKYKAIAMSILGARAAERYDPAAARSYFQRAIAASRPQDRMQIRRMAEASIALAERRPDDLKEAVEKLGQTPPTGRQLFGLRVMGLIAPAPGASALTRIRGILLLIALVVVLLGIGFGLVELISLPFGRLGVAPAVLLGFLLVVAVISVLAVVGRRRARAAREKAAAGG
jgi:hypothetical protein